MRCEGLPQGGRFFAIAIVLIFNMAGAFIGDIVSPYVIDDGSNLGFVLLAAEDRAEGASPLLFDAVEEALLIFVDRLRFHSVDLGGVFLVEVVDFRSTFFSESLGEFPLRWRVRC